MRGFLGRSDDMVKLRGVNVYPTAINSILNKVPNNTGEFFCHVRRNDGQDEMTVSIESNAPPSSWSELGDEFRNLLREKIGVDILVRVLAPGALVTLTEIDRRQKPLRLSDDRLKTE